MILDERHCRKKVYSQDLPVDISTSLLSLVAEESNLRARLQDEADLLEKELATLTTIRQNATCGCPATAAPIAFSVTLKNNIATLGKEQAIVYDEINLNIGNSFDARHGIFTAPVDGPYEFTFATLVPGGKHTGMEIVKNGESVAKTESGDSSYYTMGTNVVALDLKAGDEVWVRHIDQSDSNIINGQSHTSFSGYLIEG
ncbi:complement C1q tumor necrosis factor-related protein 4-like isoform X2 [Mercenaria mercenaria]|uniref:complement C1q tumor necrosis factor-related protein 4-like isoform X2 n=1 Tax=Mercenaria mercenaria TaxID=6596 RepID=UPI00234F5521|nr:complement C1q tumor necrosis factor-related protein 4-like isoform X2 [Mercenaria mercenaria]